VTSVNRASTSENAPRGAYGLVLEGLDGAAQWMQPQKSDAPTFRLHVEVAETEAEPTPSTLDEEAADLALIGGGRLRISRGSHDAFFTLAARPSDAELLHPYLAPAAALFWQWSGREAIHAGAFGVPDGAVLILGDKEAGKSTTLAWLAGQPGVPVLTDDLAVMDGRTVLAGPRSIDLRLTTPSSGAPVHLVRDGERDRLQLTEVLDGLPLVGLAVLEWASQISFTPIALRDRFEIIDHQRTFHGIRSSPIAMLELGSVPMVRAGRPRDIAQLPAFGRALVDYFS
jgi:hypothetical protein